MTANIADAPATTVAAAGASWRQRWFGGLTWKGLALIVALCVLNSMRRAGDIGPLAEWLPRFAEMFALVLIALLPPTFAIVATYNRAPAKARWRYPALAVAIVIASAASTTLMGIAESRGDMEYFLKQNSSALWQAHPLFWWGMSVWPRYAVLSVVIAVVFVFFRVREESEIETQRAELERVRFAQQMEEARLQMLQAQIEPHFLFNTLANVRRLYQSEPAAGETMLDNLMRYLAVALPQMRAADTTIGRESILIESYLNIQRIRMGARLSFEIDVPDPLREVRIPPLMLLTLVENSIKHGLNPLPEGGSIRVTAEVADGVLRIRVIDTGGGFTKSSGGGTGLANTRARLAAVYGPAAKLALTLNQPHGVTATITVPWSGGAAAAR